MVKESYVGVAHAGGENFEKNFGLENVLRPSFARHPMSMVAYALTSTSHAGLAKRTHTKPCHPRVTLNRPSFHVP